MFINQRQEVRLYPYTTSRGHPAVRRRSKTVFRFRCNSCECDFERDKGDISSKRLNNDVSHYCSNCFDYGTIAKKGQQVVIKNLEKRIGQKWVDSCGYVNVYVGPKSSNKTIHRRESGYCGSVREHVLVVEKHLGRSLRKGEVVHHIDGDKSNNSLDNLDLCTVAEHNSCHAKAGGIVFELYKRGQVNYDLITKQYFLVEEVSKHENSPRS